ELEEPGQADEIDAGLAAEGEDTLAEHLARGAGLAVHDGGGDAGLAGAGQAEGVGAVGDDQHDVGRQPAGGAAGGEVWQGGAGAAEEDGEAEGGWHGISGGCQSAKKSHAKPQSRQGRAKMTEAKVVPGAVTKQRREDVSKVPLVFFRGGKPGELG